MIKLTAPFRGSDAFGSGEFLASRGTRKHQGMDYLAFAGSKVHSLKSGKVTKLGYPYADDLNYRYVEVTDEFGYRLRYYYVSPLVELGDSVNCGDIIGEVQNLDSRYKGIPNHVHFEIKRPLGESEERIHPAEYIDRG